MTIRQLAKSAVETTELPSPTAPVEIRVVAIIGSGSSAWVVRETAQEAPRSTEPN